MGFRSVLSLREELGTIDSPRNTLALVGQIAAFTLVLELAVGCGPAQVKREHRHRIPDADLPPNVGYDALEYVGGIGEEGPEEADGGELEGEAQSQGSTRRLTTRLLSSSSRWKYPASSSAVGSPA